MKYFSKICALCIVFVLLTVGTLINPSAAPDNAKPPVSSGSPVDYVNMYIGTGYTSMNDTGGTIPGVTMPFGMTQWTAMTKPNSVGSVPYGYADTTIMGFVGTRQPAIWMGDYGSVDLMPQIGEVKPKPEERKLSFKHSDEKATPYYYNVKLDTGKNGFIGTEITATERCGFLKFKFPKSDKASILVEAGRGPNKKAFVQILPETGEIIGYNPNRDTSIIGAPLKNFKGYFVVKFSKPFKSYGTWASSPKKENPEYKASAGSKTAEGIFAGAYATFTTAANEEIQVKVATSLISLDQARENLKKEIPDWDFEKVKTNGKNTWNSLLSRVDAKSSNKDVLTNFYTSMYHSLLFPRILSEYGKYYSAFDDKVHNGVSYNDYSLWDTFRAEHPLLLLVTPERAGDMITSMLQMYKEGGWLPKWPNPMETNIMIGTHADSVIADAYVKGIRNFDLNLAYQAVYKDAMTPPLKDTVFRYPAWHTWNGYEVRAGLTMYKQLGYVACDKTDESVSNTLEGAYDDFCVAQLAKAVGKSSDYDYFMKRSKNYKNLYNTDLKMMMPKDSKGNWMTDERTLVNSFSEGSPWTYLFCAMQDIPGLVDLMGKDTFISRLDENFSGGHYVHANQPGHHYAYLYNYCGQPWKTQERVRKILASEYKNAPDGLVGNDDCGQMSAWYILSAMGFYSVTPGTNVYALGCPILDSATIYFDKPYKKAKFNITAKNLSDKNIYVQKVTLNGKQLNTPFIKHSDIVNGGTLVFELGPEPNPEAFSGTK